MSTPCGPASREATVSLRGLTRARTTIEDFAKSYLPLHGLHPHDGLLRHLDVLVYVSASLYEMDELNEDMFLNQGDEGDERAFFARANSAALLAGPCCCRPFPLCGACRDHDTRTTACHPTQSAWRC